MMWKNKLIVDIILVKLYNLFNALHAIISYFNRFQQTSET